MTDFGPACPYMRTAFADISYFPKRQKIEFFRQNNKKRPDKE
jgi:hypothetical protein